VNAKTPKRILVAEDDRTTARIYQLHFRRAGLEGHFFERAAPAMDAAARLAPHLALLDYELPDMRGLEIMRALHAIPGCEHTPVIFVTGRAKPSLIASLEEAGAVAVLGKPFSPAALIRQIQRLVA